MVHGTWRCGITSHHPTVYVHTCAARPTGSTSGSTHGGEDPQTLGEHIAALVPAPLLTPPRPGHRPATSRSGGGVPPPDIDLPPEQVTGAARPRRSATPAILIADRTGDLSFPLLVRALIRATGNRALSDGRYGPGLYSGNGAGRAESRPSPDNARRFCLTPSPQLRSPNICCSSRVVLACPTNTDYLILRVYRWLDVTYRHTAQWHPPPPLRSTQAHWVSGTGVVGRVVSASSSGREAADEASAARDRSRPARTCHAHSP